RVQNPFQREGRVQIGHDHRYDRSRSPEYANLGRIAFELGFLDPSSFTRAFRRWTAMSPTAFREQFRQSDSTAL
ncbi:MAG: helix-turn-helix domain-containing protein, partial [Pseudoalteromonas distincta]